MPIAPIHESKEALRPRAICDERITLPLSVFREKVSWQRNVAHRWAEDFLADAAGAVREAGVQSGRTSGPEVVPHPQVPRAPGRGEAAVAVGAGP